MYGDSGKTNTGNSEFTVHAAGHILKRTSPFVPYHVYGDNRPLLNRLNRIGYNKIEQLVQNTFPDCNIKKIRQIYAPQMYGMYLLHKEEFKNQGIQEKLLFHVTSESNALQSLESGLDWRRTERAKFGCGVSFSDDADYANYYANNFSGEDARVIMICCVLVGETYVPKEMFARSLIVPPDGADTTVSVCRRVSVKYNDYEFYPLYFVYYKLRPENLTRSKYFKRNNRRTQLQLQYLERCRPDDDGEEREEYPHESIYSLDYPDYESLSL